MNSCRFDDQLDRFDRYLGLENKLFMLSIFDFAVITNPNRAIFDSTDRSLSYLSKSTIFANFSPQFIVLFDQIPKDLSKIP